MSLCFLYLSLPIDMLFYRKGLKNAALSQY